MNNVFQKIQIKRILFLAAFLLVLAAIIAGLIITGGPLKQRKYRLDEKRISIISDLSLEIKTYYRLNSKLPVDLKFVSNLNKYKDPKTFKILDYAPINDTKFKICTTFETSDINADSSNNNYDRSYNYNRKYIKHPSGYHCFIYSKNKNSNFTTFDLIN